MTTARKTTLTTPSQKRKTTQAPVSVDVPLSPHWAFVVQFRAACRVEHLVSGRTSHFQSLEEPTVYLAAELRAAEHAAKR
jgi:hypothetical protein